MLTRGNWTAHLARLRAFARLLAALAAPTPAKMVIVGDRTERVAAKSKVDGSISRTVAANHCGKLVWIGVPARRLTDRVSARAHHQISSTAAADIRQHCDSIELQIE